MRTVSYFIYSLIICLAGCSWHSMYFDPVSQPIYFGMPIDTSMVDSIDIISGTCIHEKEEESTSQSENFSISFGGEEFTKENVNSSIKTALINESNRFIANGRIILEIEQGLSTGAVFSSCIATIITEESSSPGTYVNESIYFLGTVYRLKNKEKKK